MWSIYTEIGEVFSKSLKRRKRPKIGANSSNGLEKPTTKEINFPLYAKQFLILA